MASCWPLSTGTAQSVGPADELPRSTPGTASEPPFTYHMPHHVQSAGGLSRGGNSPCSVCGRVVWASPCVVSHSCSRYPGVSQEPEQLFPRSFPGASIQRFPFRAGQRACMFRFSDLSFLRIRVNNLQGCFALQFSSTQKRRESSYLLFRFISSHIPYMLLFASNRSSLLAIFIKWRCKRFSYLHQEGIHVKLL